jgi:uncharacterized protein
MIVGIDFGAKTAGTTVIALYQDKVTPVKFVHTVAGHDADKLITETLKNLEPSLVFLDAPLSLPMVYRGRQEQNDYFYRKADRDLNAMSPMFLGGLTARAMSMSETIHSMGHKLFEAYPAGLVRELGLAQSGYKKAKRHIAEIGKKIAASYHIRLNVDHLDDWHHVDALLCMCTGLRKELKNAKSFGYEEEGLIWV